jgi:hypothetical protein
MPSGDRVELRATLLQLTNPSIPGEAKRVSYADYRNGADSNS